MGPEFWQTFMGKKFFESDVPRGLRLLERLVDALEANPGRLIIHPNAGRGRKHDEAVVERAKKVRGTLLPEETHTSKVRNKLQSVVVVLDELRDGVGDSFKENEITSDAKKAVEEILDHLAAIDVDGNGER